MLAWLHRHSTLILILALALILRLPLLNGSFWLDEAAQALEADRPFSQQLNITDDFQPPLLHLITFFSLSINRSEWWLRLIGAVIPSLISIWGVYLLGHKLANQKVGLLASLFLATNSFYIFFSQELRPYSLSVIFVVWSWFFLLEATRTGQDSYQLSPKNPFNRFFNLFPVSRDFFLFLLMTILGLYSSYLYPFVFASQIIFLLSKKNWSQVVFAIIIPTIAFLPWLPEFLRQLAAGQALRQNFPGWENIVSFSLLKAPILTFGKFLFGVLDLSVNFSYIFITCLFCFFILFILFRQKQAFWRQHWRQFIPYFYFLVLPFLLASLVSLFVPVIQPKRVIFLLPFIYLFLAYLIFGLVENWRQLRWYHWSLLILILAINVFSTFSYYTDTDLQRENWRHALTTLHQEYNSTDTLALFAYAAPFSPWTWYEQKAPAPFPTLSTGNYDTNAIINLDNTLQSVTNYQNVVLFDYLRSLTDSSNLLPQYLLARNFTESRILDYPNLGFIRIYTQKPAVLTLDQIDSDIANMSSESLN